MSIDVYTGKDLVQIDDLLVNDLGLGKVVEVRFPNESANLDVGKDGNAIATYIANGDMAEVTLRLLAGQKTDAYLLKKMKEFKDDPASYVGINMKLVKKLGDGKGNVKKLTYDLQVGLVSKNVESEEDVSGDMEQAQAIYSLKFTRGIRTIS